jgi:hypothetical protein
VPPGGAPSSRKPAPEPESGEEEEEDGGLSRILQPGEQVLIGALNVTVKKFFFHAYLTNQRIFLIDTQEKKLRVTAKDVARSTIAGSIVEFSENSDPVLVLSIRSPDDEIKTMKLVFVQNGMDRSAEIDEWIALLQEDPSGRKAPRRQAPAPEAVAEPDEEPAPRRAERPVPRQPELHPARKPTKDLEKQPPVKRLLSMYNVPEAEPAARREPEPEIPVPPPARRTQVRQVQESARKAVVTPVVERENPLQDGEPEPVRKPEVQSAMKVAMKSAMRPLQQQGKPVRRTVAAEPLQEEPMAAIPRRPVVHEPQKEKRVPDEEPASGTTPQFCHNCGKKLPHAANFCPGCGTRLSQSRTLPQHRHASTTTDRKTTRTDPPSFEHRPPREEEPDEDEGGETPMPAKPPVKKAPRGSEMTILHKFLRR